MKKYILRNGITLLHQPLNTKSVTIEVMVKVGSNNERAGLKGISHFIEHMLFEGTKKRLDSSVIAAEIEDKGGDFNAYTTVNRTAYHIKILSKHFLTALDVLSDMFLHSTFTEEKIKKEKKVIIKEIHMILDDPRFYKWILFQKTLFTKHPSRWPTYGLIKDVKSFTRKKIVDFFTTYYTPQHIIISVVGNVKNVRRSIEQAFTLSKTKTPKEKTISEPKQTTSYHAFEKRKTQSSYLVLGYQTCSRRHKDSYALDILEAILGKGQSGRMFEHIRNKHGLSYEVGVEAESEQDIGYVAVHASTDHNKLNKTKSLALEQFKRPVTKKEVEDAKTYIEGSFLLDQEDTQDVADSLCYWERVDKAENSASYIKKIKEVSHQNVLRVQKKYFSKNYVQAVVGPTRP